MRRHTLGVHVALLLLVAASVFHLACTGSRIIGRISPSTFQFHNVVPQTGSSKGGWKVAQVIILLGRISPMFPEAASCDIEVGVPAFNWQGRITNSKAQQIASLAADKAARQAFAERLPTALMCQGFRLKMETLMKDPSRDPFISGAKVSGFNPWDIEIIPRTFP